MGTKKIEPVSGTATEGKFLGPGNETGRSASIASPTTRAHVAVTPGAPTAHFLNGRAAHQLIPLRCDLLCPA